MWPLPSSPFSSAWPADWSWSFDCSVLFLFLELADVDALLLCVTLPLKHRRQMIVTPGGM